MKTTAKKASTALAEKKGAGLPAAAMNAANWGAPQLTSRDIVISKILAMQGLSKAVTAGTAKYGEFVDSMTGTVLGDTKTPIEIIPFFMEKIWTKFTKEGNKFKGIEAVTPENQDRPQEEEDENGDEIKLYYTLQFYVLLPSEVKTGTALPRVLSFKSTSLRAGSTLSTIMYMKNLKAGKIPAAQVVELSGEKQSNDMGSYITLAIKEKRASTEAEMAEAFEWLQTVRGGKVKVDDSDLQAAGTDEGEVPAAGAFEPAPSRY